MKTKLVLWGHNEKDEKILIALQLRPAENKVDIWTFPDTVATDDFARELMNEWRNDKEVAFPDEKQHLERELSVTESLLPEDIKVDRGDIVQRAQTEWHFVVLSSKLNDLYKSELADLKEKVAQLTAYNSDQWEELKAFWGKVQGQVKERNLLREHADVLRDDTNKLFDKMKQLRSALDDEFRQMSQGHVDKFMSKLEVVEKNIGEGNRLPAIFDELKGMQRSFREIKLTREHRSKIWNRLDAAFKAVKEKRFGPSVNSESSAMERLTRRYNGLIGAIDKMKKSIDRDEDELAFQQKRIDNTDGQLEAQIRQAKINMTTERIRSKKEKYEEMTKTREDLDRRIASQKEKDAKRKEKKEVEAAKEAAKEKIAKRIQEQAEARKGAAAKLAAAAGAIVTPGKAKAADAKETVVEAKDAVAEKAAEVKEAVAEKASDAKETIVEAKDAVAEKASDAKETIAEAKDAVAEKAVDVKEAIVDKASDAKETISEAKDAVAEEAVNVKEAVSEKATGVKDGLKVAGGVLLGAGAAALSSFKDAKDAVVDTVSDLKESVVESIEDSPDELTSIEKIDKDEVVSDLKESVTETIEDTPDALTSLETKDKQESNGEQTEDENLLDKASDVMEDVTDGLSATFKAGAAAIFGAGAAAAGALSGGDEEKNSATTSTEQGGEEESAMDKVTDVVEDLTDAATSTLKNAAGALFGLGAATAKKISGEDEEQVAENKEETNSEDNNTIVEDIAAVSEIVEEKEGDKS